VKKARRSKHKPHRRKTQKRVHRGTHWLNGRHVGVRKLAARGSTARPPARHR
jgi:hypothetical protein